MRTDLLPEIQRLAAQHAADTVAIRRHLESLGQMIGPLRNTSN